MQREQAWRQKSARHETGRGVSARDLSPAGRLDAAGIASPFVFHLFGQGVGRVLLPMYLPIVAAGSLVGPGLAVVGLTTPLLSAVDIAALAPWISSLSCRR